MPEAYEKTRVAVDAVIFTIEKKRLKVLLSTREKEPFKGKKELPGGLLRDDETAEDAMRRKLNVLIGNHDIFVQQFNTFTEPRRDPRERTISIGFVALISQDKAAKLSEWHDCQQLPALAFDHKDIIIKAKKYLKENISSLIVKQFLPAEFPLNLLHDAYETIEETTYDNRNFRKRMTSGGIVEECGKQESGVSHRPAKLFKFKE